MRPQYFPQRRSGNTWVVVRRDPDGTERELPRSYSSEFPAARRALSLANMAERRERERACVDSQSTLEAK